MNLTFTQCKQIINNGGDLREFLEAVNDQPKFLQFMGEIDSIREIQAISKGGCASGAYMPAVTYHIALECMAEWPASVENQIVDVCGEDGLKFDIINDTFAAFCSKLCSMAVENWCQQFDEILTNVDWD